MQPAPANPEQRLFTALQAATYLGCSYSTIRRLAYAGELPVVKPFGRDWRVDRLDLDKLITRNKVVGPSVFKK